MILKSHLFVVDSSDGWRLEGRRYRRAFRTPLRTARSVWEKRVGLVLRVDTPEGLTGFGELAPVPFFPGVDDLEESSRVLWKLDRLPAGAWLPQVAADPLARTGLSMALAATQWSREEAALEGPVVRSSVLVPMGEDLPESVAKRRSEGYTVFKSKIGSCSFAEERPVVEEVLESMGTPERLRLDANASLDIETAERWLRFLEDYATVDYLEEPLASPSQPIHHKALVDFLRTYRTPIALDESILDPSVRQSFQALDNLRMVIKPSLFGDREELRTFVREHPGRVIFSTAFEMAFGFEHLLRLAASDGADQVHGFSGGGLFQDARLDHPESGPVLYAGRLGPHNWEDFWDRLPMI